MADSVGRVNFPVTYTWDNVASISKPRKVDWGANKTLSSIY